MPATLAVSFGPFRLDIGNERLSRGVDAIALTPKAFAVLSHLAQRPAELVTKDALLDAVWPDTHVSDAALKVVISELRKALGDDAQEPHFIATVHRRGYRFVAPVTAVPSTTPRATSAAAAAQLVGRSVEIARLEQAFALSCSGARQLVFVTGEGGIGKTALIDAFEASLPASGVRHARGQCLEHHGSGEAYLPILEALGQLCRGEGNAELIEHLRRHAPTWLSEMPGLRGSSATIGVSPRISRESMQRELADVLEVITSEQPLVLILEDMHWSDVSSVDLLARLAHRRTPAQMLIVATYRPVDLILQQHPLKILKQRLDQQRLCTELRLPYLGGEDVENYLRRRFDERPVPVDLGAVILERTGGNALFVVNLVDDLLARRWLVADDDVVRVEVPLARIGAEVPEGVRQMIETQVERLPAEHALYLEAASVVGEEFPIAAIAAALAQPREAVERFCEAEQQHSRYLTAHGVAHLADGEVCGRYRFSHALYRDVFYQRIGGTRRVLLHRRIGDWLEAQGGSPAELARHFVEAVATGRAAKALEYSRRAAERAASLFAYTEAAAHYQTALSVLGHDNTAAQRIEECRLRIALGECLERSGTVGLAADAFVQASQLARELDAPELFAQAALGRGRGHHPVSAADPQLIALLEEGLERIGTKPSALRASLLARLDTALSPIPGAHARREPMALEALDYARRHGDPETQLLVLQYTRWAFNGRETPEDLRQSATALQQLAATTPNSEQALQLRLIRLTQLHELAETATADAELTRFRDDADAAGILWFQWFAQRLLAYRALEEGRFDDAEHYMQEALTIGQRTDHPNVLPTYGAQRICLYLQRGAFAEIEPQLDAMRQRHPEQFTTRAALAYARTQLGDHQGARREFDAMAADNFGRIPRDSLWLMVLARLTEVCTELGDAARAQQLRELFEPYAERIIGAGAGFASVGHGRRYLALQAQTSGQWDEAADHFEYAINVHDRMGARPWLVQTLFEHGRLLRLRPAKGKQKTANQRRADAQLERASNLAQQLGMRGVEAAIERLGGRGGLRA